LVSKCDLILEGFHFMSWLCYSSKVQRRVVSIEQSSE
jgi:hypothetical protein